MNGTRPFVEADLSQVCQLYQKVFSPGGKVPSEEFAGYLAEVFLHNPWRSNDLSSLVYEEEDRRITGFLGLIPRRMIMKGRSITMAVGSQFMVDPDSRSSFAGVRLIKTLFAGSHDVAMTDGANAKARQVWEAFGGVTVPIYSIYWTRMLQPCFAAVNRLAERPGLGALATVAPLGRMVDTAVASHMASYRLRKPTLHSEEETDVGKICGYLAKLSAGASLRPEYDARSLGWLLRIASQKQRFGRLRNEVLWSDEGDLVGWCQYYLNVGGVSQVLQIAARPNAVSNVLDHVFCSARRQGSTAIAGRIEPRFLHEFYHRNCRFSCGSAMLVQAKDEGILRAICTGDAYLSRLEGEWWNRFSELAH
jgi:hypothetical protein